MHFRCERCGEEAPKGQANGNILLPCSEKPERDRYGFGVYIAMYKTLSSSCHCGVVVRLEGLSCLNTGRFKRDGQHL
jgi:hypothetical protein